MNTSVLLWTQLIVLFLFFLILIFLLRYQKKIVDQMTKAMTELFESHRSTMIHSLNLLASKDPMTVQALSAVSPNVSTAPAYVSMTDEAEAERYEQSLGTDYDDDTDERALRDAGF